MDIQEALKETEQTETKAQRSWYVKKNEEDQYFWYIKDTDEVVRELRVSEALGYIWQPYHDKKEIRPEKVGEHWANEHGKHLFAYKMKYHVHWIDESGEVIDIKLHKDIIHCQNGWTRIYPPVEDENIERIEFENVIWGKSETWPHKSIPKLIKGPGHTNWGEISDATTSKPPGKMTLEWPKENKEP